MKNALLGLLFLAYPVIVYFGLKYIQPSILAALFALLFIFRHFSQKKRQSNIPHLNVLLVTVLSLLAYTAIANSSIALKFYPVVVNLSFLVIFAYTLIKPPCVVEIIARLHEELDEQGIAYTRKVTKVWCGFFIINAAIATWTVFHENEQFWLVYNGLISYLLMGTLMLTEFVYRKIAKSKVKSKVKNTQTKQHNASNKS